MKQLLIIIMSICIQSIYAQHFELYLSPEGDDANNGTELMPVKSIAGAREVLKKTFVGEKYDEVSILFSEGDYKINEKQTFDSALFSGQDVQLTLKSIGKKKACISGGNRIPTSLFKKTNSSHSAKLHKTAVKKVYVANLKGSGLGAAFNVLGEDGEIYKNKSGDEVLSPKSSDYSLLTWNEHSLQVACWPNRGYNHIDTILEVGPTNRWLMADESPAPYTLEDPNGAIFTTVEQADWTKWDAEFKPNGQMVVQGYLHNDWYFQNERIGGFDKGNIELLHDTRYGVVDEQHGIPRRVRVVNLLCELNQPGEWYYDVEEEKLYLWPIAPLKSSINISVAGGGEMLIFDGLNNVTVENLVFQNGGSHAVIINGGNDNTVGGCDFQNFVGRGVTINGGKNNGVQSCLFRGLFSAASINGGNRSTLEKCNNYFINNEITECRLRGYGVVSIGGCGIRVAHNLFHKMNGALSFGGNDIIIEYNEYYNMGWEMGDWNAAYTGADWASFGNKFQYNFIHHLIETPGAYGIEGVRNDDLGMGVAFKGNVFYKSGRGSIAYSGAGNDCIGNIALETRCVWQSFYISKDLEKTREEWEKRRAYDDGLKRRGDKEDNLWRAEQHYGKMGWLFEPYRSAYPRLCNIMKEGNPFSPTFGSVVNNYVQNPDERDGMSGHDGGFYMHGCKVTNLPSSATWEYPETITMDAFVDPSALNFKMKDDFKAMDGFEKIAFEKIGLVKDKYRSTIPEKDAYRKAIKQQFEGVKSTGGRYNMKEAYKRFPLPSYLE